MGRVSVEGWMTYDKASELCRMAGLDLAALKKAAITEGLQAGHAAGRNGQLQDRKHAAQDRLAQRGREAGRQRPRAEGPVRRSTPRTGIIWGAIRELKGDQIYNGAADNASGSAGSARNRPRVYEAFARAEAVDSVPLGDRRRAGLARCRILRGESALSAQEHAGRHQYGRPEHLGQDEGHDDHRPG